MKLISPSAKRVTVLQPLWDFVAHRDPSIVVVDGGYEEKNHDRDDAEKSLTTDVDHSSVKVAVTR